MNIAVVPGADDLASLVRPGRVHRRYYIDPAVFNLEMERIFRRAWLWLGHESQLKAPGDFITTRMGRDRIIVARHTDGAIHAFHNRCAHRGAEVCPKPSGNAKHFLCPYHSWTFRTDGSLEAVPLPKGYAELEARRAGMGLERVPRVASYRGFVFGSQAAEGPGLEEFLGPDVLAALDNFVDRAPGGELVLRGGRTVQRYRANWKLQAENSLDLLHPGLLHRNAVEAADRVDYAGAVPPVEWDAVKSNGLSLREWDDTAVAGMRHGHTWMGGFLTKAIDARAPDLEMAAVEDVTEAGPLGIYRAALAKAKGVEKAREILAFNRHNTLIYPNLFINPRLQQVRILHPVAVDVTEQHGFVLDLKGSPPEMFEAAVRMLNTNNSPASIVTTDDHETFERIQESLASGREEWVDWGRDLESEPLGERTVIANGTSELPMRNQQRAWASYMARP